MKLFKKKIFFGFGLVATSTLPLTLISCGNGKGDTPNPSNPTDPSNPTKPVEKTFNVDYLFNVAKVSEISTISDKLAQYERKLREFETSTSEFSKLRLNSQLRLWNFSYPNTPKSAILTRQEYTELVKPILDNNSPYFSVNWDLELPINFINAEEAKEFENNFQNFFNNFYVKEQWWKVEFKQLTDAARTGKFSNKLTLEAAQTGNKLAEYNAVVAKIKQFFVDVANVELNDDIKIIEIDPDYSVNWGLTLKFQNANNIKTGNVRLDIKKANNSWTDQEIEAKNANNQFTKKIVNKVNELLASPTLMSLLKILQTQFIINFDETQINALANKILDSIQNYLFNFIAIPIPNFVINIIKNKINTVISPIVRSKLLTFNNSIKSKLVEIAKRNAN
ncbi:hypothetical protein ACUZ9N_02815 [Mycoplasmopsis gallinarum]